MRTSASRASSPGATMVPRAQGAGQVGFVAALRLRHDLPLEAAGAQCPHGAQRDRTAPDHQHGLPGPGRPVQHGVHPDRQRLDQDGRAIGQLVGNRVELALVRDQTLAPAAGQRAVIPDRQPPRHRRVAHRLRALLPGVLAGRGEPRTARRAPRRAHAAARLARDHGIHRHALAEIGAPHRRAQLDHARDDLVSDHGGKRAERLHGGAGLVAQVRNVAPADPAQHGLEAHPVGAGKRRLLHIAQRDAAGGAIQHRVAHTPGRFREQIPRHGDVEGDSAHGCGSAAVRCGAYEARPRGNGASERTRTSRCCHGFGQGRNEADRLSRSSSPGSRSRREGASATPRRALARSLDALRWECVRL